MTTTPPALTGEQLISLLEKDGWVRLGYRTHGVSMQKKMKDGQILVTVIPIKKNKSIAEKTLGNILSVKQTRIGKAGLIALIEKYGV